MEVDPNCNLYDYNIFYAEGERLEVAGRYRKAIESYTKALGAVSPNGLILHAPAVNCLTARSKCHLRMGDHEAALADAQESLKDDPKFIKGLYAKAEALYFKGDFEYALVYYHRGAKIRSELSEFRVGIQKSSEAINNAIGTADACKLEVKGDLTEYYAMQNLSREDGGKEPPKKLKTRRAAARAGAPKQQASQGTVRALLGELYADRQYLASLMSDLNLNADEKPDSDDEEAAKSANLGKLVGGGLEYLDKRANFWRQQKPIYARKNDAKKLRNTGGAGSATASKRAAPAANGLAADITRQLEELDQLLDEGQSEKAITKGSSILAKLEKSPAMDTEDKNRILGNVYSCLGQAHLDLDHLAEAEQYHKKDLNLAQVDGNDEAHSRALGNVGRVYARTGHYSEAIEVWLQKKGMMEGAEPVEQAWLNHEVGRCYMELGNHVSALEFGEASLKAAKEAGDGTWQMNAAVLVAQAQAKLGDTTDAKQSYATAVALAKALQDTRAQAAIAKALSDLEAPSPKAAAADEAAAGAAEDEEEEAQ